MEIQKTDEEFGECVISLHFDGLICRKVEDAESLMREAVGDFHRSYGFKVSFAVKPWVGGHVENEQFRAWLIQVDLGERNAMVSGHGGAALSDSLLSMRIRGGGHLLEMRRLGGGDSKCLPTATPNIMPNSAKEISFLFSPQAGPFCISDMEKLGFRLERGKHCGIYFRQTIRRFGHAVGILTHPCRLSIVYESLVDTSTLFLQNALRNFRILSLLWFRTWPAGPCALFPLSSVYPRSAVGRTTP